MFKSLFVVAALILVSSSSSYAITSCDRRVASAERKVSSTEKTCERSQDRVVNLENAKLNILEALRTREEIANSYEPTDSISCAIAEAFGECDARRRRRRFVAELNRREAQYNRRIKTQQDRANRDCLKFSAANDRLNEVKHGCGL